MSPYSYYATAHAIIFGDCGTALDVQSIPKKTKAKQKHQSRSKTSPLKGLLVDMATAYLCLSLNPFSPFYADLPRMTPSPPREVVTKTWISTRFGLIPYFPK